MMIIDKFKKLRRRQKVELITASVLSVALLISIPVYAWFAKNKKLETMTKIQEPGEIVIRSGRSLSPSEADPIVNFEMQDIDIKSISEGKAKQYVFSVMPGEYNTRYDIQLAHTTNIPFTYSLYKASEVDTTNLTAAQISNLAVYHPRTDKTKTTYYQKVGNAISMVDKNLDNGSYGRYIAKKDDSYYDETYSEGDDPEIYAVPVYSQTENYLSHQNESDDYDYYILELGWDDGSETANSAFDKWNNAENNKETDMIYITASRHIE